MEKKSVEIIVWQKKSVEIIAQKYNNQPGPKKKRSTIINCAIINKKKSVHKNHKIESMSFLVAIVIKYTALTSNLSNTLHSQITVYQTHYSITAP